MSGPSPWSTARCCSGLSSMPGLIAGTAPRPPSRSWQRLLAADRLVAASHGLAPRGERNARDDAQTFHARRRAEHPRLELVGTAPLVELGAIAVADERGVHVAAVRGQPEPVPAGEEPRLLLRVEKRA